MTSQFHIQTEYQLCCSFPFNTNVCRA